MTDEWAAVARVRALAEKWIAVPMAGVYGPDINSYGRAVLAALDGPEVPSGVTSRTSDTS